jgi:hypothetical protein
MKRSTLAVGWWLALFGLNVLGILPWAHVEFPIVDLGETVYHARRLQLGYVPYRDTFTHHFIGYVLPFYAIQSMVPLTPLVLKIASLCFNFSTAIVVFLIVREIADSWTGLIGAFLAVTIGWFWNWEGFAFNIQSCLVPIFSLMLLLVIRTFTRVSRAAFCGAAICGGTLLIFDQRAAALSSVLVLPPLLLSDARRPGFFGAAVASFAFCPLLAGLYLWRAGAWADFIEQTLIFPLRYRNHGLETGIASQLSAWFAAWLGYESIPMGLMLVGLAAVLLCDTRRWLKVLFVVALISASAYSMAGGRLYPNYFLVCAPLVLVLGSLIVWYSKARSASLAVAAVTLLIVVGVAACVKALAISGDRSPFTQQTDNTVDVVARYLHAHTSAQDRILVWGYAPQIYVLSDRFHTFKDAGLLSVAGANFSSTSPEDQGRIPHMVREFDEFLTLTPPKSIVFYEMTRNPTGGCFGKGVIQRNFDFRRAPNLKGLKDVIAESYRSSLTVEGPCDRAELFERR